jgi:hypothetical protein
MNRHYATKSFWHVTGSMNGPTYKYHWEKFYLKPKRDSGENWCGDEGVKSGLSNKHIQEMQKNNVIVSYQATEGIVGLARLASGGYCHEEGYWTFNLKTKPTVWFENPLTCAEMRNLPRADKIEFIKVGCAGTVFKITQGQFANLVKAVLDKNRKKRGEVEQFLGSKE